MIVMSDDAKMFQMLALDYAAAEEEVEYCFSMISKMMMLYIYVSI